MGALVSERRRWDGQNHSGPGNRRPEHGCWAAIERGEEAEVGGQKEPASATYFRDLKPVSGSRNGVPMTTDVGSLRSLPENKGDSP